MTTDTIYKFSCPVCGTKDKIRFVFIEYYDFNDDCPNEIINTNPADTYNLFMCPNNHIYDMEGTIFIQKQAP